jgi:hypothetical protein
MNKENLMFKHQNKLIPLNDNYDVINCAQCGKEFARRSGKGNKRLAIGIRGRNAKNCSRQCSRKFAQEKLKLNNNNWRKHKK